MATPLSVEPIPYAVITLRGIWTESPVTSCTDLDNGGALESHRRGRWLAARPWRHFSAAVGAVPQPLGARRAIGALVAADERLARCRSLRTATLAALSHLQRHMSGFLHYVADFSRLVAEFG